MLNFAASLWYVWLVLFAMFVWTANRRPATWPDVIVETVPLLLSYVGGRTYSRYIFPTWFTIFAVLAMVGGCARLAGLGR